MRGKMLTKRRPELTKMQERLINGYLGGAIDEPTFQLKSADLKSQIEDVQRQLDDADEFDPAFGKRPWRCSTSSGIYWKSGAVQPCTENGSCWRWRV